MLLFNISTEHNSFQKKSQSCIWEQIATTAERGCRGRDRMIVGFTTTYAISSYHH